MSSANVGDRVGVIWGADSDHEIRIAGFGVRVEDSVPTGAVGWWAELLKEAHAPNPTIQLDSGEIVYGCECWWGPEAAIKRRLSQCEDQGAEVQTVSVADRREQFRLREKLIQDQCRENLIPETTNPDQGG